MGSDLSKKPLVQITNQDQINFSNFEYKYANRRIPYRMEELEISSNERNCIMDLLKNKGKKSIFKSSSLNKENMDSFFLKSAFKFPRKLIIDTDIGTDIDDVMALLLALNLGEELVDILAITTNYHPTLLRKRVVEEIIGKTNRNIKIIAGPSAVIGSHRSFFHAGNEGDGLKLDEKERKDLWRTNESLEAPEYIIRACKEYPRQITIISLGIPTNLGLCCYLDKEFGSSVGHIVLMGGGSILLKTSNDNNQSNVNSNIEKAQIFETYESEKEALQSKKGFHLYPNHNISGDTLATKMLFESAAPITLIPHFITKDFWFTGDHFETLLSYSKEVEKEPNKDKDSLYNKKKKEHELLKVCSLLLEAWLSRRPNQRGQCPHDPLTLYEGVYPCYSSMKWQPGESQLEYERGWVVVHEWASFITFIKDEEGNHRIAVKGRDISSWIEWFGRILIQEERKGN